MARRLSVIALGSCAESLELFLQSLQILVRKILQIDKFVPRAFQRPNDFVQFQMHRLRVAVLGVMNEEDHQERDDGRTGIDNELPGIRKMKGRPGETPDEDNKQRAGKRPGGAEDDRRVPGEDAKCIANDAEEVALSLMFPEL